MFVYLIQIDLIQDCFFVCFCIYYHLKHYVFGLIFRRVDFEEIKLRFASVLQQALRLAITQNNNATLLQVNKNQRAKNAHNWSLIVEEFS